MPKVEATSARLYGPLARSFGRRMQEAVDEFPSKAAAASAMGLSTDQVNKIISEKAVPNFASVAALAEKVGKSLDWFAFGGAKLQASQVAPDQSTGKSFSCSDDSVLLPRLGGGIPLTFSRAMLAVNFEHIVDHLAVLDAPGNAMEPTIKRSGLLIVDRSSTRTVDGEIFVFDFAGDLVVRRTQREPDGGLMLRADNASYDLMRLSAAEASGARVLGRVVWIGNPV